MADGASAGAAVAGLLKEGHSRAGCGRAGRWRRNAGQQHGYAGQWRSRAGQRRCSQADGIAAGREAGTQARRRENARVQPRQAGSQGMKGEGSKL